MSSANVRRSLVPCAIGVAAAVGFIMIATVIAEEAAPAAAPVATPAVTPAAAPAAAPAAQKTYSGTFSDTSGRKGPMQCQMAPGQGDKWSVKFTGKNEGQGPNRPYEFAFDLTGKKDGEAMSLSGTPEAGRQGAYEVSIAITGDAVEGKFKKPDGKNSGTFSLKLAQPAA